MLIKAKHFVNSKKKIILKKIKMKNNLGKVAGVILSIALLYGVVYVAGKGWKKSQQ